MYLLNSLRAIGLAFLMPSYIKTLYLMKSVMDHSIQAPIQTKLSTLQKWEHCNLVINDHIQIQGIINFSDYRSLYHQICGELIGHFTVLANCLLKSEDYGKHLKSSAYTVLFFSLIFKWLLSSAIDFMRTTGEKNK